MCVTDRHDITLAVKVALNPDTANKPNFPRAKKERNKECTNHSAKKAVKAIFYTKD